MANKILIVEDEPDLMAPLVFALRKEGFRTVSATTGAEGIKLARTERPDVLLLDWMLPDTSRSSWMRSSELWPFSRANRPSIAPLAEAVMRPRWPKELAPMAT